MAIKGIEKFSLLDYDDKVSCVIFLSMCNMRCPFCHNAPLVLDPNFGDDIPFDDVLSYLEKRKGLVDAVVITGGEPTLTKDLYEMISKIKELGYLVKLDTNGTNPAVLKKLVEDKLVDYVAMDIKNSLDKYPLTCGVNLNLDNIKESINYLMDSGVDYEFRTTVIKGHHTLEDMKKIGELLKGAKKYRIQKFNDRETCIQRGLSEISKEEALQFVDVLKNDIDDVALRGY